MNSGIHRSTSRGLSVQKPTERANGPSRSTATQRFTRRCYVIISSICVALVLLVSGCTLTDSSDGKFPDGPVTIVVGFAKDGGSDQWARSIATEAGKTLGVDVTVTNIVGDGGLAGLRDFLTRDADGLTLMSIVDIYAAAFAEGKIETNVAEDLIPLLVGNIATSEIYVSGTESRFNTWDDVVAYAIANPGMTISSAGVALDLEGLSIKGLENSFGIDLDRQIIENSSDRFNAPVTGVTDLLIEQSSDVRALVDAGTLRPVLSLWRTRTTEGVPAVTELDPDFPTLLRIRGLAAHKTVSSDRLNILKDALDAAFASPGFQQILRDKGLDVVTYPTDPVAAWQEQIALYQTFF
jgi:putative tricarboxylic transport membrane protein